MNKRFTKLIAALALLVFMTPSLVAWGQSSTSTITIDYSSVTDFPSGSNITYGAYHWESDDVGGTINCANGNQNGTSVLQFNYSASGTSNGRNAQHVANTVVVPGYITGITMTKASGTDRKWNAYVGTSALTSTNYSESGIHLGEKTVSSNGVTWTTDATNHYNYFYLNYTVGSACYISSIVITYEPSTGPVTPTCATPTFNPAAGTYTEAQNVTISCATAGATIYYTTNGDVPTTSSTVYAAPISVSSNMTIKAMAAAQGYDNSAVATAEYTIEEPSFNQDWEGTMHGWSFVSVTGDQVWNVSATSGNHYAKMSGYASSANHENEDWCISPAFDLSEYSNPVLTFKTAKNYTGNDLVVYFSNNYDGQNLATATWQELVCTLSPGGSWTFVESGNIDMSSFSGSECYIGFKYTSTTSAAATWELDDIVLANQPITPTITLTPSSIDLGNNNATDVQISKTFTVSQSNLTEGIVLNASIGDLTTTTIAQGAEDTEITWTYTPTEAGSISATITATSTGAETQTLTITGAAVAPVTGDRYEMVTEAPQDWSGCYIITGTNSSNYYALTGVTSNLGTTAAVTVVGNSIESNSTTDGYQVIVEQTTNGYSLYMNGVGYLYYSGSKNELYASETFTESTSEWTFSISDNHLVTLANVSNTDRKIQFNYNTGNSRFACYTSNQVKLTLFKYTGTVVLPPVINVTNNTISLEYDETEGSVAYTINNPVEGQNLTATTTADWISNISVVSDKVNFTTTVNEGNTDRTATITLSYTGATDKTVTVTQGRYVAPFEGGTYTLATSIESGKTYIIVGLKDGNAYAMGTQRDNNRGAVAISIGYNESIATVDPGVAAYEFVIESVGDVYSIYDARTPGYLYAASSTSNHLKTEAELDDDDNGLWAISLIDEVFSVVAGGNNTHNVMRFNYNNGSPIFACYESETQFPVYLFVKEETPTNPTITVDGYGDTDGGYVLIASPTVEYADPMTIGMATGNYDLYYYDAEQELEWRNYKAQDGGNYNLEPGKGYLYANQETVTITFTGDLNPSFSDVELPYAENDVIKSLYLAGNSSTQAQTFYVNDGNYDHQIFNYLTMNEDGDGFITTQSTSYTAPAMTGFFVQAPGEGMALSTYDINAKANVSLLNINVLRDRGSVIDNAIVSFSNGSMMDKFYLKNYTTRVYIPQGNREMAIANSAAQGEMPVSFRAAENGTYTLSIETENVEMDYLHLIDNMTGMDVDLLQTPNYTFEAKTSDYASRFRLVFSANGIDEQNAETFAYFNGSEWMVSNLGESTLQVVDVMGRVLSTETISGNAELSLDQPAGVYMLRLINGNDVKVQKVIVR